MVSFLSNEELIADDICVNLTSGEVTLRPDLMKKAISTLEKVKRYRDIIISAGTHTNGYNTKIIDDYLDSGIMKEWLIHLSWDGVHNEEIRPAISKVDDPIYRFKHRGINVRTALTSITMKDIDKTLDILVKEGYKNWEYYMIIERSEYDTDEFVKEFDYFMDVVYSYTDKLNVYNIERMKNKDTKWCRTDTIAVSHDGKIYSCGIPASKCKYGDKTTVISDLINLDVEKVKNDNKAMCKCDNDINKDEFQCSLLVNKGMFHVCAEKLRLREIENKKWSEYSELHTRAVKK